LESNIVNYFSYIVKLNKRDGSVIYGSNQEVLNKVRTFKDGKIKISKEGHLLHNEDGTAISGDIRNSWAGVTTLQTLFVQEHNAVCDALKVYYIHLIYLLN
jgi:alpha-dioxygenase